jgi:primosomal protein N' (replication factor Y)
MWLASYYHCSLGEVMKAALPSGLKLESETKIILNPDFENTENLSQKEELTFKLLSDRKIISVQELNNAIPNGTAFPVIKSLLQKNVISVEEHINRNYKPKTETFIELDSNLAKNQSKAYLLEEIKISPKQQKLLEYYLELSNCYTTDAITEISKKTLLEKSGISNTVLTGLINKNILKKTEKAVDRLTAYNGDTVPANKLSPAQGKAWQQITDSFKIKPVVLLHGVTSSGKTEIYIELINECLERGEQVLYLLPEIGLTTQIISRLKLIFGNRVGVYHSKFNDSERVEIWNKVLENKDTFNKSQKNTNYQLVVGARSSIFLPFNNLGLIIVDEEHENSYKQFDPAPRYNARDAAILLGHQLNTKVLLGSATPAIETYFNAQNSKFGFVQLKERYKNIELPEIVTADLKDAYKRKQMRSHFAPALFDEMTQALERKEQIILFQNRRGFAPFIICSMCGWIPKCNNCDVSLTYHKHNNSLVCHYCGYTTHYPVQCKACGGESINTKGFGTEKIEDEVALLFPEARIARMDLDTTRAKRAYENIISNFEKGNIDILIGTQMVTKGLDFENVSIVGILNADNMLNYPDFRAFERSYQLMAQVSGRAGRKHKRGKVIIQTTAPEHRIIQHLKNNDYEKMYEEQLAERKHFKYPPFYRLVGITIKHRDKNKLEKITAQTAALLRNSFKNRILGPEDPVINRIQTWYIKKIWIKIEREISIVNAKKHMQEILDNIKSREGNSSAMILVDVDPM